MKKLVSLILIAVLALSLVACTSNGDSSNDETAKKYDIADSKALLTTVWNGYADDEKFSVIGGDTSEENLTDGAPGTFSIADAESVDNTLGLPAASIEKIDGAASVIHMMNANNFTAAAYHATDIATVGEIAKAVEDNLAGRQWICGIPEKLVIFTVDDYVVTAFGAGDLIDVFTANLTKAYPEAAKVCDKAVE